MTQKIRLSHSTLDLLGTCERKFQLERLMSFPREGENAHFQYGHSFGAGVASYLTDQNPDKALVRAWLEYDDNYVNDNKTAWTCQFALQRAFPMLDNILNEYEIVQFVDHAGIVRPATELSFRINIDDTFYFVGYIDAVLVNKYTNKAVVFEAKSTGLRLLDLSPLYRHSGQALGYSIALDSILGTDNTEYGVLYFVDQIITGFDHKTQPLYFDKNILDRLNWFMGLGLEVERIKRMLEVNHFPLRYTGCKSFNKTCHHFGVCHLHSFDRMVEQPEDDKEYAFVYDLNEIVAKHMEQARSFTPTESAEQSPSTIMEIA